MKTLIKYYKFVIVLVITASFTSCSSDDDSALPIIIPEPTKAELLANKWFLVKQEDSSTTPPTTTIANDCEQNSYFDFQANGDLLVQLFDLDGSSNCTSAFSNSLTYTISSNEEEVILTDGTDVEIWTFTVTASELVMLKDTSSITLAHD